VYISSPLFWNTAHRHRRYNYTHETDRMANSMVTQLHPWTRNRGSIPGKSKGFFSPPKWLYRLLGSSMFLTNGQREYLRASGARRCLLTSIYTPIKNEWSYTSTECLQGKHSDKVPLRYRLEHSSRAGIAQPRNSLRAGRSGDPIPVAAGFSASFQTGPGTHPASCTTHNGCRSQ